MAPNGSQRLPTAPYDYKHTLLLFSSSMTPTDFHLLPPRELTRSLLPAPHSLHHDPCPTLPAPHSLHACEIVCKKSYNKAQAAQFVEAIDQEYRAHWIVDNLPVST